MDYTDLEDDAPSTPGQYHVLIEGGPVSREATASWDGNGFSHENTRDYEYITKWKPIVL